MTAVAAAILAAGSSSRLGTPKQLLELNGSPLLTHVLEAVRRSSVDRVFVVLGHESRRIRQLVEIEGVNVVDNPEYSSGQSSSVRVLLSGLPPEIDAVVFVLGDQPMVEPEVIDALVAARRSDGASIAQPRYAEGRGNPILVGRELFDELLELTGDVGARPVLERHREQTTLVDVSDHHRPDDIDTFEDFERVRLAFESRRKTER